MPIDEADARPATAPRFRPGEIIVRQKLEQDRFLRSIPLHQVYTGDAEGSDVHEGRPAGNNSCEHP